VRQLPADNEVNGSRGLSIVGIRFRATANEDIEDLACAVVRSRVRELVRAL
jgi:hypothetical protein